MGSISVAQLVLDSSYPVAIEQLGEAGWGFARADVASVVNKLTEGRRTLGEVTQNQILRGVVSGLTDAFIIEKPVRDALVSENPFCEEILRPVLNGRDIRRYRIDYPSTYLIYTYHGVNIRRYPEIVKHLRPYRERLEARATEQQWYELQQPQERYRPLMESPKLVFPDMATSTRFELEDAGWFGTNTVYFIPGADRYLLGLLNSTLAFFFFRQRCAGLEGRGEIYLRFFGQYLGDFPVSEPATGERDAVAARVDRLRSLEAKSQATRLPQEKEHLRRQIEATDRQIDQLVYELYGLSDSEIRVVEGSESLPAIDVPATPFEGGP